MSPSQIYRIPGCLTCPLFPFPSSLSSSLLFPELARMILPQGFALAVPSTWMALSPEISPVYLLTSFKPLPKDTSQGFPYSKPQPSPFHSPHNSETYFSVSWLHLSYHHLFYLLFVFLSLYAPLRQNFLGLCFFFFNCQDTPHLLGKYLAQCRCLINEWLND